MSNRLSLTRWGTQLCLVALSIALLASGIDATASGLMLAATTTLPLLVAAALGFRKAPRWGLWTAVLMTLYFSFALTDMLTNPVNRWSSGLIAILSVVVFFTAIDVTRMERRGRTSITH